ncbi:MAG: hypothetical protein IBJ11_09145, partial [Phycisphaerales bacterium]|nr:hypothetical protein [Phycisphaerales bacterium]
VGGRFVDYFKRFVPSSDGRGFDYEGLKQAVDAERQQIERERQAMDAARAAGPAPAAALPGVAPAQRVLQVHNSYIVTQDEQGVVIIDQHALHERVMFEKLRQRLEAGGGKLQAQRLIMPAVVPCSAQQLERAADLGPVLERLGIEAEPIGASALAVHAFPTFLFDRRVDPVAFMADLLDQAEAGLLGSPGADRARLEEAALHEVLDMMACKAAVKAGDALSPAELEELLTLREQVERSSNCPHGRPTAIRLTLRDLEKRFGRS